MAACIPVKSLLIQLLVKKSLLLKTQQLILGTGTAIWWLTEPHYMAVAVFLAFLLMALQ
jgi:hypothetical protein